jgi:cardiolipin synthase
MSDLWAVLADIASHLAPARLRDAAARLPTLDGFEDLPAHPDLFGPNLGIELWTAFATAWADHPEITPREVAAGLRVGARLADNLTGGQSIDLVWTGPDSEIVPVRSTEQVMLEIIGRAHKTLFLVTFVNVGAKDVIAALCASSDQGVRIRMLLEGSKQTTNKLAAKVPGAEIYYWAEDAKPPVLGSTPPSVHAKCIVADRQEALITSANLTDYAMDLNIELGAHIIGGREPKQLEDHLNALIITKKIQPFAKAG